MTIFNHVILTEAGIHTNAGLLLLDLGEDIRG